MRISVAAAIVCLSAIGISTASDVEAAIKTTTNIPAQGLGPALQALAKDRGFELLYLSDLVDSLNTRGATGDLTTAETLQQLLSGTGLTYRYLDENTVTVLALSSTSSAGTPSSAFDPATHALSTPQAFNNPDTPDSDPAKKAGFWDRFRLAQNDQSSSSRASDSDGLKEDSSQSSDKNSENRVIDEVVVTGSHIRGVENNTVPLIVLDKAYIDSTGYGTTTQLMESLPQNFALNNQSTPPGLTPDAIGNTSQGSSVSLRGVGQGTTLILLNGRRMAPGFISTAVDISALPLSAIDRVEVLTDGASALYGSDAVGGVVNFVLRQDFEGAETRLRAGWADPLNEYRLSQTLGTAWGSGNALLSLEYYKRDLLLAKDRDFVPDASIIGSLLPRDKSYSVLFSSRQNLSEAVSLFADALHTQRDSFNKGVRNIVIGGTLFLDGNYEVDNPQTTATVGLDWQLGGDWKVETAGSYARNELDQIQNQIGLLATPSTSHSLSDILSAQAKADGPVSRLPGGEVTAAIGVEWRDEYYRSSGVSLLTGLTFADFSTAQVVRSAFAQVYVPVVGSDNAMTGARRLELSLAGRLDDYSNFGSSFDPQLGIMWEPVAGLRLRASRGSSYKPPDLYFYDRTRISASALVQPDPLFPAGSFQLRLAGADVFNLSPQESENTSFGLEFAPESIRGLRVGINYYKIEYTDRIAQPGFDSNVILGNPSAYGSLIARDPTTAQVNEALAFAALGSGTTVQLPPGVGSFTPDLVDVILDLRTQNLSVTETNGLDVSLNYGFDVAGGKIQLDVDATHILELVQQITSTSAPADRVDTLYNPVDWRVRGSASWQRGGLAANLFVNYTDSYLDNRTATPVPISSFTTMDAHLAYDFTARSGSFLSGVKVSANVQNLFDRDPPPTVRAVRFGFEMGFDPMNASPLGRLISIELSKNW